MSFANAPFLGDILSTLQAAASAAQAPLEHFRPPASAANAVAPSQGAVGSAGARQSALTSARLTAPSTPAGAAPSLALPSNRGQAALLVAGLALLLGGSATLNLSRIGRAIHSPALRRQQGRLLRALVAITVTVLGLGVAAALTSAVRARPWEAAIRGAPRSRSWETGLLIAGLALLNVAWIGLISVPSPALRRQRRRVLRALVPVTVTVLCLGVAAALPSALRSRPWEAVLTAAPRSRAWETGLLIAGLALLNVAWIGLTAVPSPALRRQRRRVLRALVPVTVTVLCVGMAAALTRPLHFGAWQATLASPMRSRAWEAGIVVAGLAMLNMAWVSLATLGAPALRRHRGRVLRALVPITIPVLCIGMAAAVVTPRLQRPVTVLNVSSTKHPRPAVPVIGPVVDPLQSSPAASTGAQPQELAGPAVWVRLLRIEGDIARTRELLANAGGGAQTPPAGKPLSDEVAQARSLESTALADERSFYMAVAGDATASAQLVAAASASGDAEAIAVIGVDLGIVRAELSRQQAITDAERALAKVGSLQPSQLSAIAARAPFIAPVLGPITQGFGPSALGFEPPAFEAGVWYPHFHTGLDIAAPLYSPIHVAADGTVLTAGASNDGQGNLVGYGRYVVIAHPQGFVTLYGHLSQISVHAGELVHQGEILGLEGSTGNSTGPHLHFEIRSGGDPINPMPFVGPQLNG